jgi:hypothetical protein
LIIFEAVVPEEGGLLFTVAVGEGELLTPIELFDVVRCCDNFEEDKRSA